MLDVHSLRKTPDLGGMLPGRSIGTRSRSHRRPSSASADDVNSPGEGPRLLASSIPQLSNEALSLALSAHNLAAGGTRRARERLTAALTMEDSPDSPDLMPVNGGNSTDDESEVSEIPFSSAQMQTLQSLVSSSVSSAINEALG